MSTNRTNKKPATLADVARKSGVAAMTVSRAINNSGYVSPEVRKRVMAAARALQYRPNMLARQLKGHSLKAIGILLPDIANPFSTELVSGIREVLVPHGYTTFIATTDRSSEEERAALQSFVDHRIDGVIVATRGTRFGTESLQSLAKQNIPTVVVGRDSGVARIDSVMADHYQGAFDAVTHLISIGHRRIGFIGIAHEDRTSLRRYAGYAAALKQAGIAEKKEYIAGPPDAPAFATQEDGFQAMMQLLDLPKPPTAIFARNDFAAIGALRAAHTRGCRVPQEIAIAGFDNIPLAAFTTPPLTTVEQPIHEQGAQAARLLLDRLAGTAGRARTVVMHCRLVPRESTLK
ncbi:MAG: LacI family DNA-binding transcriptional regulator [Acidobacteria bacterium]|nr:LacI family DNA-binding transcriptional regulator [Acidobacteriota bacterium]